MEKTIAQTGFKGSFAEFLQMLRTDPKFYPRTAQELLEKASEIAKRADGGLPPLFNTLPRLTYDVRPVPAEMAEGYTTGRYWAPDPVLDELEDNDQVVLRYAPGHNFNGSSRDIAGVCNRAGNVLGLMPHPEHAVDVLTGSVDGLKLIGAAA